MPFLNFSAFILIYMKKFSSATLVFGFLPLVVFISGCSSAPATFTHDSFSNNSPYQQHVGAPFSLACSAAERTLLGDGYSLDTSTKIGTVKGRKAYLMSNGRSSFLEMSVVCLPDASGSTIYANGLISQYDLKKSANAASVGVSVLGSISMPIGQSVDSMVKVSDETIRDRVFYKNFFAAVNGVLNDPLLEAAEKPAAVNPPPAHGADHLAAPPAESLKPIAPSAHVEPSVAAPPASAPAASPSLEQQFQGEHLHAPITPALPAEPAVTPTVTTPAEPATPIKAIDKPAAESTAPESTAPMVTPALNSAP